MKAILIDIGNSQVRAKVWTGADTAPSLVPDPRPLDPLHVAPTASALSDPALFRGELDRLLEQHGRPRLVLVSVVPRLTEACAAVAPDLTVIDERSPLPFASDVDELAAVGPDRLANVAAACAAGCRDAIVVDAGTATTFDVLQDGRFRGGWIAPGMAFAARKLGEAAARLEPQPFGPRPAAPGRNTADAMAAGAWHVGVGGVESALAALLRTVPAAEVILTGGLAGFLPAAGRHLDPDWTLRGAAFLTGLAASD